MTERRTIQEIVYEALIECHEVVLGGVHYRMTSDGDLAVKLYKVTTNGKDPVWMRNYMGGTTMKDFFQMCEKATEEERTTIVANLALDKSRRK